MNAAQLNLTSPSSRHGRVVLGAFNRHRRSRRFKNALPPKRLHVATLVKSNLMPRADCARGARFQTLPPSGAAEPKGKKPVAQRLPAAKVPASLSPADPELPSRYIGPVSWCHRAAPSAIGRAAEAACASAKTARVRRLALRARRGNLHACGRREEAAFLPSRLGAQSRCRRGRVLGPRMLRVAAA